MPYLHLLVQECISMPLFINFNSIRSGYCKIARCSIIFADSIRQILRLSEVDERYSRLKRIIFTVKRYELQDKRIAFTVKSNKIQEKTTVYH